MAPKQHAIIMIVGPSGCGKDTIIQKILAARPDIYKAISCTTRPRREGEKDGVAYHFVSPAIFRKKIAEGEFAEWAQFPPRQGDYYGTLRSELEEHDITLLKIEIQGARHIKEAYPRALIFFIIPPTLEVLRERILSRGDMPADKLQGRLERAIEEMKEGPAMADCVVLNNDGQEGLEKAVQEILVQLPR